MVLPATAAYFGDFFGALEDKGGRVVGACPEGEAVRVDTPLSEEEVSNVVFERCMVRHNYNPGEDDMPNAKQEQDELKPAES